MAVLGATGGASSSPTKSESDSAVLEGLVQARDGGEAIPPVVARIFFGRQHLTFDKGRAWMPEVERPEFRKDAKPTERSYGKCGGAKQGIVRFWKVMRGEGVVVQSLRLDGKKFD